MPSTFRAYIDESGDEGFVFKPDGAGSSRWFVLSALVVRTRNDHELIRCLADVRKLLGRAKDSPLHFIDLKHEHRRPYVALIARTPVRGISVVAHKPSCDANLFSAQKYLLYRYLTRLLVERISWLCRDSRVAGEGNGTTELIFSNRTNMSYQDIRDYLVLLKSDPKVNIEWTAIDPAKVTAIAHEQLAGLQGADALATSVYLAANLNRYGLNETAYAEALLPKFYRHQNTLWNYGVKWFPGDFAKTKAANPHLEGLAAWK
jgi:Protein of unknown function (DUF3800)